MERVTIVIPVYKESPSNDEKRSFKQCLQVLSTYSFNIVTYPSLNITYYETELKTAQLNYSVQYFDKSYFKNIAGYNRLLMQPHFYKRFNKHTYALIYQLDAFVFTDELQKWCKKGYSYIGAPWIMSNNDGLVFTGVGNGGFSLRNINDHLRALHSFSYIESPVTIFKKYFSGKHSLKVYVHLFLRFLKQLTIINNTFHLFNNYNSNEDYFWCKVVAKNYKWFTIPVAEEALSFSMEHEPAYLYKLNHYQLPFGCHAWPKHDLPFWKPFIEQEGYHLP
ncbi:MAG: DUF5672 family protein [Bacteroidota bacterium]